MKQVIKIFCSILALLSAAQLESKLAVTPYYSIRSQGTDAARYLLEESRHINLVNQDGIYASLSATTQYTQSFNPKGIAQSLFGSDAFVGKNIHGAQITVSGTRTANRGINDWLADYFYLPPDFKSTLNFAPAVQNVIVDLGLHVNLDAWVNGLFFSLHAPINWTKWDLHFNETLITTGTIDYYQGYFTASPLPRANLLNNFSEFACGKAPQKFVDPAYLGDDVTFNGLTSAKFDGCAHTKTRLADLSLIVGYNFIDCENYHLGLGVKACAPTGNIPTAELLFEPISGNGGHWELGAQMTGHTTLWQSQNEQARLECFINANVTNLFKTGQARTFDLKDKPLSRYMLAEKMATPLLYRGNIIEIVEFLYHLTGGSFDSVGTGEPASSIPVSAEFAQEFSPVANFSTHTVFSSGIQGDIAVQLTYSHCKLSCDLGYNFWGRNCEKLSYEPCPLSCQKICTPIASPQDLFTEQVTPPVCVTACTPHYTVNFQEQEWALKGDAQVFGFSPGSLFALAGPLAIPLSATESKATINAGTNIPAAGSPSLLVPEGSTLFGDLNNHAIDNPLQAYLGPHKNANPSLHQSDASITPLFTSVQPITIKASDFNYVATRGITHKIYANINYNVFEKIRWIGFVSIGGFGEFNNSTCGVDCQTSCVPCALSQWSAWVKFGASFD
ncbi:MAG: hypothetical protein NTX86_02425 [Candidatus Dependentiae bacterium]|nr:hypothetical protein [Candidatus Dependentiae bacterium]